MVIEVTRSRARIIQRVPAYLSPIQRFVAKLFKLQVYNIMVVYQIQTDHPLLSGNVLIDGNCSYWTVTDIKDEWATVRSKSTRPITETVALVYNAHQQGQ